MTTYTVIPQDDLNLEVTVLDPAVTPALQDDSDLDVVVQEADNPVIINITPAAVSVTSAVLSVNGFTGIVELTTTDIPEGTNLYYTDDRVNTFLTDGSVTSINFDNNTTASWNANDATLDLTYNNGVALQVGQETHLYAKATEAITDGQAVQYCGAQGSHLLICRADAQLSGFHPDLVVGLATQDFANNEFGYVTTFGKVRGLKTDYTGWTEGAIVFLDVNTPGGLTITPPPLPQEKIQMGIITRVHQNQGTINVRPPIHDVSLSELHGTNFTNLTNTDLITWQASTNEWINITNNYATTSYVDTADAGVLSDANSYTDGVAVTTLASANSYTDSQGFITASSTDTLTNKSGNISQWTNDAGYLTSETDNQTLSFSNPNLSISNGNTVDLSGLTPDLTGYATEAWVSALPVSTFTNDSGYITSSALTPYYTSAQVDALPVSTFTNDAGYLTTETDSQTLSLVNNTLSISNGNSVDLGSVAPDETDGGTF